MKTSYYLPSSCLRRLVTIPQNRHIAQRSIAIWPQDCYEHSQSLNRPRFFFVDCSVLNVYILSTEEGIGAPSTVKFTPPLGPWGPQHLVEHQSVAARLACYTLGTHCGSPAISGGTSCEMHVSMGKLPVHLWS